MKTTADIIERLHEIHKAGRVITLGEIEEINRTLVAQLQQQQAMQLKQQQAYLQQQQQQRQQFQATLPSNWRLL